jgi:hypothetical protein
LELSARAGHAVTVKSGKGYHEGSSYIRWHQEHDHPQRARRAAGQTDCRVQRTLHSYRDISLLPTYAIDDQTAIKAIDDTVEVVSEEHWKLFTPDADAGRRGRFLVP